MKSPQSALYAAMLLLTPALAGLSRDAGAAEVYYDYAEVIRVDPIIQTVERPVQRDQCWREPVTYREPARERHSRAPAILGAIVGGVIGNQFGGGSGRDAMTAAGAMLGYHSVRDDQRRYGGHGYREVTRYEQRCSAQTEYFRDEQVTGYDVSYRYNGEVYRTTTDFHPGRRLRVEVGVRPAP